MNIIGGVSSVLWRFEQQAEHWLTDSWHPGRMPNLAGKVAVVTGGSSGIGLEVVRKLAENCCKVYMVARTREGGEPALQHIRDYLKMQKVGSSTAAPPAAGFSPATTETIAAPAAGGKAAPAPPGTHEADPLSAGQGHGPGSVELLVCDLGVLSNVTKLVSELKAREKKLDILVANASLFMPGPLAYTPDGIEQTLATNYYAHAALILELLDIMTPGGRIVLQSSIAEQYGTLNMEDLKGKTFTSSGMVPYGCTKLWILMFGDELQRRLKDPKTGENRVDVFGVHPGLVDTPLQGKAHGMYLTAWYVYINNLLLGMPAWRGAYPALYATTAPELKGKGFKFFGPTQFNMGMTLERKPTNRLWHTMGIQARRQLFDETVKVLQEAEGVKLPSNKVPKAVV